MRPLTEPETKVVFDKLANYCTDLKSLIAPLDDGDRYVFRLNHSRVGAPPPLYLTLLPSRLASAFALALRLSRLTPSPLD